MQGMGILSPADGTPVAAEEIVETFTHSVEEPTKAQGSAGCCNTGRRRNGFSREK